MHTNLWTDMFVLTLPIWEKILRSVVVYIFLVIGLRLAGKRELAQLNPFDLVVLLTLSNTVQNAIIGDDNSVTGGLIGASTLLGINYLVVRFLYRHRKLEQVVEGRPDVLIEGGRIRRHLLREDLITLPELQAAAHRQGFASLEDVERAVLEPGGTISFIAKKPAPEESRHLEVMKRLDQLREELARFRGMRPPAQA
ncbi:MAG TPA: YetF domain-containing protein [Candidatus Acidoferrales bacterium]|nr:YetF domain-containing protein [Candidatus Acidoferrales bacterium]